MFNSERKVDRILLKDILVDENKLWREWQKTADDDINSLKLKSTFERSKTQDQDSIKSQQSY